MDSSALLEGISGKIEYLAYIASSWTLETLISLLEWVSEHFILSLILLFTIPIWFRIAGGIFRYAARMIMH